MIRLLLWKMPTLTSLNIILFMQATEVIFTSAHLRIHIKNTIIFILKNQPIFIVLSNMRFIMNPKTETGLFFHCTRIILYRYIRQKMINIGLSQSILYRILLRLMMLPSKIRSRYLVVSGQIIPDICIEEYLKPSVSFFAHGKRKTLKVYIVMQRIRKLDLLPAGLFIQVLKTAGK